MLVVCERWVGGGDRLLHIDASSSDHSRTFFLILAGVAQPWITEGPKPSVCRWLSLRHLVPNWLQLTQPASGTWLYNCLTRTCLRYSFAYLHRRLIDGSVEGQYVTLAQHSENKVRIRRKVEYSKESNLHLSWVAFKSSASKYLSSLVQDIVIKD